jgi:TonB family protein
MNEREFTIAIAASILLHILLALFFNYAPSLLPSPDKANAIEVYLQRPDGGWQLADIPEPKVQVKPKGSKFLGMYNQSVPEETVARDRNIGEKGNALKESGERRAKSEGPTEKKQDQKTIGQKDIFKFDGRLFAGKEPQIEHERNEVSSGAPSRAEDGMPEDYYPDYKLGAHTYVNVLRYPDVEYFVRLKRIFKMTWDPVTALRREVASLSVSRGMVSCVLAVSVNKGGDLSELFILKSSGLPIYDDEALRTVKASSPFSAPPEKFLKNDGLLRMSWTFVVYL